MIISANEINDFTASVSSISQNNPFACRVISLYNSYNPELPFVDYWLVCDDETQEPAGAIARNGTSFILMLTDLTDLDEVSSFMRVAGATTVLCDGKYELDLFGSKRYCGAVLMNNTPYDDAHGYVDIREPYIKSVYNLIVRCSGEGFEPPKFEDFYVDVNHRLRHKAMRICGVYDNDSLVAAAMTVSESENGAVIGAVACDPEYRRKGCGSLVVKGLSNMLLSEGKKVYLHRVENANEAFYNKLGFKEIGKWCEYHFEY